MAVRVSPATIPTRISSRSAMDSRAGLESQRRSSVATVGFITALMVGQEPALLRAVEDSLLELWSREQIAHSCASSTQAIP